MHAGGDFLVPERIVIDAYNKLPSIDPTVNLGVRLDADASISDVVPIDYGLLSSNNNYDDCYTWGFQSDGICRDCIFKNTG